MQETNHLVIPSFREQYAVVYDDYMDTLGGGERSALAFALALQKLEFNVEIISTRPTPSPQKICEVFGEEFSKIPVTRIKTDNITKYLLNSELRVFVNHTYMSFHRNPAKLGIYAQMFPGHAMSRQSHPEFYSALQTYNLMLCNSSFTKEYSDGMWDYPSSRSFVLNPPIGQNYVEAASSDLVSSSPKKKKFVHVGRFNPGNHNKNQLLLIQAFNEAKQRSERLRDWELTLIGNVNNTPESKAYYLTCKELADRSDGIKIFTDLPHDQLQNQVQDAFSYVHGTGAFIPPGSEPHKCEHYGLSIVEAMAQGCIPLVYARGGVFDVMEVGKSGLIYLSFESLVASLIDLTKIWGSPQADAMKRNAMKSAASQGQNHFTRKLGLYIASTMRG